MSLLNTVIVKTLPLIPKPIVRKFANRYIAGDKLEDAVNVTRRLNEKGIMTTMDVLGEDVFNRVDATKSKEASIKVLDAIENNKLNGNLSLKLTSMGLKFDFDFCLASLKEILFEAKKRNIFVRIDMEDSSCTDDTIRIYQEAKKEFSNVGIVIQTYLHRSYDDVDRLIRTGANFRICKGIYIEPESIAFKSKEEINNSFLRIIRNIFANKTYVGIATHDEKLVEGAYKLIEEFGKRKDEYEFQMLLGVRENLRDKILKDGHRLRVYIPFGTHWYQYSIRRFKENPHMAGYVFKSIFSGK